MEPVCYVFYVGLLQLIYDTVHTPASCPAGCPGGDPHTHLQRRTASRHGAPFSNFDCIISLVVECDTAWWRPMATTYVSVSRAPALVCAVTRRNLQGHGAIRDTRCGRCPRWGKGRACPLLYGIPFVVAAVNHSRGCAPTLSQSLTGANAGCCLRAAVAPPQRLSYIVQSACCWDGLWSCGPGDHECGPRAASSDAVVPQSYHNTDHFPVCKTTQPCSPHAREASR